MAIPNQEPQNKLIQEFLDVQHLQNSTGKKARLIKDGEFKFCKDWVPVADKSIREGH